MWLVAGFSLQRPRFSPRPVHVGFVMDRVALGHVFLQVLQFSLFSIILQMYHTHIYPSTFNTINLLTDSIAQ